MLKKSVVVKVYDVYKDGELMMTGTRRAIIDALEMPPISLANYSRRPYRGHYIFKDTGRTEKIKIEDVMSEERKKPKNKKDGRTYDEVLGYLFRHLFRDGVVNLSRDDPERYLEDLAEMGLDVEYRPAFYRDERGKKVEKYYILKVKK